jgi:DNA-directed RNA polymerase specialized sigma subunit
MENFNNSLIKEENKLKKNYQTKTNQYLKPQFLFELICDCIEKDELKPELFKSFELLIENIMRKNYYSNEQDKEDCKSGAMLALLRGWKKFDSTKSTNAFSFLTACVKNGLIVTWNEIHPIKVKNNISLGFVTEEQIDSYNSDFD